MSQWKHQRAGASKSRPPDELLPGIPVRDPNTSPGVWAAVARQQALVQQLNLSFPAARSSRSLPFETTGGPGRASCAKSSQSKGKALGHRGARRKEEMTTTSSNVSTEPRQRERVISKRKPLTLTQKLGLEEAPPSPLDEGDWNKVKMQSSQRGDSDMPCAICHDVFSQARKQVILSCSHTFHLVCLEAFETFSRRPNGASGDGSSQQRGCPMCRRQDYEKRLIFDGARSHRWRCARLIQAVWRGHVVRKWFRRTLLSLPMPTDKRLKRRYLERKMTHVADCILKVAAKQTSEVDALLADVDEALRGSRHATEGAQRYVNERCAALGSARAARVREDGRWFPWLGTAERAVERYGRDGLCAVCVAPLPELTLETSDVDLDAVLLSCSHVFHSRCLAAVERFSCTTVLRCPLCRSTYARLQWRRGPGDGLLRSRGAEKCTPLPPLMNP